MPSPKLLAVITAILCIARGGAAFAAYDLDQLREIERLIQSKDCGGLRFYIDRHPGLLTGRDPLANELRSFASGVDTGLIECLSVNILPDDNTLSIRAEPQY
jgi:hypothetical protein